MASCLAWRLTLGGLVQGVGFRPFVHLLARQWGLTGWVRNRSGRVEMLLEGPPAHLQEVLRQILNQPPPGADPRLLDRQEVVPTGQQGFAILAGELDTHSAMRIPPDASLCAACRREVEDRHSRRQGWPFTACCQCGPRYTILQGFPYERERTTLAAFPLCPACQEEYRNPDDRRFHAQATGCPACGPCLCWEPAGEGEALACGIEALRAGAVVAVKGIGGYHLLADATRAATVAFLRQHKPRPHKPLAILLPWQGEDGLDWPARLFDLRPVHRQALTHPARPIVLCPLRTPSMLVDELAPGLTEVGAMLPYSPLHHLLARALDRPLVATSANPSGEPVIWTEEEARLRLDRVAGGFLHHNRPILRPADDSVVRVVAGQARPLRLGRGHTPLEMVLARSLAQPTLAVGGEQKVTVALAWENRVVISPHIGDLRSPRGLALFGQVVEDLQSLLAVRATRVVRDGHDGYATSRWAAASGLPVLPVWHHHAHASALVGEAGEEGPWLVFTWDGVGLGPDGRLWGGEALLGMPGAWQRKATWRSFGLPGGDQVARQPWRAAASLCWACGFPWPAMPAAGALLRQVWQRGLHTPLTTAVGRLFDAAAALVGLLTHASYEGHGPMLLEAAAGQLAVPGIPLPVAIDPSSGLLVTDWEPLLPMLTDAGLTVAARAACFHQSMADALVQQARWLRQQWGVRQVGLCGGVFQNARLTELVVNSLYQFDFKVFIPCKLPVNDAGLSFGQVLEIGDYFRHVKI